MNIDRSQKIKNRFIECSRNGIEHFLKCPITDGCVLASGNVSIEVSGNAIVVAYAYDRHLKRL